jgi:hypothetical protein
MIINNDFILTVVVGTVTSDKIHLLMDCDIADEK